MRVNEGDTPSMSASSPAAEEPPKRAMSRSGSSRVLSSFGELSMAERTERMPKPPTRAAVEAQRAADRANSASSCEPAQTTLLAPD